MRLWNTNDGRCVMISPLDMFHQHRRPYRVLLLSDYLSPQNSNANDILNGLVLCICKSEEMFIVNVYTMTIVCKYAEDFHDIQQCQVDVVDGVLMITLIDEKAKVKIIRTSKVGLGRAGAPSPAEVSGKINFRQSSKLML